MLYITPLQDRDYHKKLAEKCGFAATEESLAFLAANADEKTHEIISEIGICEFTIHNDIGVITALKTVPEVNDDEALMIMARAVMSFVHRITISDMFFAEGAAEPKLIKALGFRDDSEGRPYIDLDRFFSSPCKYNEENKDK